MSRFDDELKLALRREDPPEGFVERLMARIAEAETAAAAPASPGRSRLRALLGFFDPPQLRWAMAGALACLVLFSALGVHRYRESRRLMLEAAQGEAAKEQLIFAMKVASEKLNVAQRKVQQTVSDRDGEK